jgi:hypothetical protein
LTFASVPKLVGGAPQSQSEESDGNGSKRRPDFWGHLNQPFCARNYDAFANGAIVLIGAFLIAVGATVFAARGEQQ